MKSICKIFNGGLLFCESLKRDLTKCSRTVPRLDTTMVNSLTYDQFNTWISVDLPHLGLGILNPYSSSIWGRQGTTLQCSEGSGGHPHVRELDKGYRRASFCVHAQAGITRKAVEWKQEESSGWTSADRPFWRPKDIAPGGRIGVGKVW